MIPRILDIDDVARVLGVRPKAIYPLLNSGRLTGFRVGHRWRIAESALQAFIERPAVTPAPPAPTVDLPPAPGAFDRLLDGIKERRLSPRRAS